MPERSKRRGNRQQAARQDQPGKEGSAWGELEPRDGLSFCLPPEEQVLLALIDAHPGKGSRKIRLNNAMMALFNRRSSGAALTPTRGDEKDANAFRRERALVWMGGELVRSKSRNLTGKESPAEQIRRRRDTPMASVLSVAERAIDKFFPTIDEVRRKNMAKQLASDFAGDDRRKAAKKRAKASGQNVAIADWPRTYFYRAQEHDYIADTLQTKAAIAVCNALREAGIPTSHPEIE